MKKILLFILVTLVHNTYIFAHSEPADSTYSESYYDLDDIVIVADKPLVQSDGTKLTYNMEEDPSSKGNTLIDALRKVPLITVDGDNNITVNGMQNFKIYVNGKEDPSLTANYKNVLKAMPAESVVKVEVITEPGAKYDAEGTGGIINLVTVSKSTTDGYYGSLSASMAKAQQGTSIYGRMKKGNFTMSANFNYYNCSLFPQVNDSEIIIENYTSTSGRFQKSGFNQKVIFNYLSGGVNLSYDISDRDLITANADIYNIDAKLTKGSMSYFRLYDNNYNLMAEMNRHIRARQATTGLNASSSWQHSFNNEGHQLIFSYLYNYGLNNLHLFYTPFSDQGETFISPYENLLDNGHTYENTVQLDYIHPFSEQRHTIESGVKGIWRRSKAVSSTFYGNQPTDMTESDSNKSDILQKQDVYSIYTSYTGKFGNLSARAGLRYELTRMGMDFFWGDYENFLHSLNDLVPNIGISYNFTQSSNIRLAYQMRISRPSLHQVNPYKDTSVPNVIEEGNPHLSSEKSNRVTLTYSNFGRLLGGNIGLEYNTIDNAISRFVYLEDNITYKTYANIGHNRSLAMFGYLSWTIVPRMQFSINGRVTRQMFSVKTPELRNVGWSLNYGANWNYSVKPGFKFNIYGGQSTRSYNLQGYSNGWYYYGLGMSKSFLGNESLTLSLNASNFLKTQVSSSMASTENMRTKSRYINKNWNVGLTLSWNFGHLNTDVKKTSVTINNDDKSSLGEKSGI